MSEVTRFVNENAIAIDDEALYTECASASASSWRREIARWYDEHRDSKGALPSFSFRVFHDSRLLGYDLDNSVREAFRAIERHMRDVTAKRDFGRATLRGDNGELAEIVLDYAAGRLHLRVLAWHEVDLGKRARSPAKREHRARGAGNSASSTETEMTPGIEHTFRRRRADGKGNEQRHLLVSGATLFERGGETGLRVKRTTLTSFTAVREAARKRAARLVADGFRLVSRQRPMRWVYAQQSKKH